METIIIHILLIRKKSIKNILNFNMLIFYFKTYFLGNINKNIFKKNNNFNMMNDLINSDIENC